MFGVPAKLADTHVVAAHTRVLANGDEVFVGEHVRWNRGRTRRALPPLQTAPPPHEDDEDQLGLFSAPAD